MSTFYLAGPTGVGKSEIAVAVAEACGGEIVGADAFQVYAGLDLLTAKPGADLRARVPHHMIGVVPLLQEFDVAQYLVRARAAIRDVEAAGRVALVVGGTGLYLRALMRGLSPLPGADPRLRTELARLSLPALQGRLHEVDPASSDRIDLKNPRRLIRAIEVSTLTGKPFSLHCDWTAPDTNTQGVLLTRDREDLYARIERRVPLMFNSEVLDEVRAVGDSIGATAKQAIGWKEARACLDGSMSTGAAIASIQQATRRYAKRQLTWFKRESSLSPLEVSSRTDPREVAAKIVKIFRSRKPA